MIYKDKFYRISGFLTGKNPREQYTDRRFYNAKELISFLKSHNLDRYQLYYINSMERFDLVDKHPVKTEYKNINLFPQELKKYYRIGGKDNAEKE